MIETMHVTDEQKRQYEDEGYFLMERALPQEHLELLRRELATAIEAVHRQMDEKKTDVLGINHRNKRYFVTLFREKMAGFVSALRKEIAVEPEAPAKVRRLVRLHFETLEAHPDMAEVVQVELRQGQKFFRGASAHEISAYFDLIASVLQEGVEAGVFRGDLPVKVATKMLFGAMDQVTTSWVLGKRGYRLADAAEPVANIFLKGVTRDGI